MSIIQVTGSGKRVASDRTSFMGATIPKEISAMVKEVKKMEKTAFRNILQVLVASFHGDSADISAMWQSLNIDADDEEAMAIVYCGLHRLLHLALKRPQYMLKQELIKEDLEEIHFPEALIPDILAIASGSRRDTLDEAGTDKRPHFPSLDNLNWRVDVAISTSVLNRVLEPTVLMEMTLSDGSVQQFEMPITKFHELRYNVAHILKEMSDLEQRSILKVQDAR